MGSAHLADVPDTESTDIEGLIRWEARKGHSVDERKSGAADLEREIFRPLLHDLGPSVQRVARIDYRFALREHTL
jgi:hypothetical protein